MIDRTNFDLRIADHSTTTARINESEWRHNQPARRPIRIALASLLVSLAARLDPARLEQPWVAPPAARRASPAVEHILASGSPRPIVG